MYNKFSFNEYAQIMSYIKKHLPIVDYADITNNTKQFCVLRHDIEYSIDRAMELALFEHSHDIQSTYFVQISNNTYNPFSRKNKKLLYDIASLGHKIGAHVFLDTETDIDKNKNLICKEIDFLNKYLDIDVNRFSFHRPNLNKQVLKIPIEIDGLINAYSPKFFSYTENLSEREILYFADSRHTWSYGHPLDCNFNMVNKMQVNCHPFSWTPIGHNVMQNFSTLISEKHNEMTRSIASENHGFPKKLL